MRHRFNRFDPGSRAEAFDWLNFRLRRFNDGLNLGRDSWHRWIIGKYRCGDENRRPDHELTKAVIQQPIVFDSSGVAVKADAKMLAAEVSARVGKCMARGR